MQNLKVGYFAHWFQPPYKFLDFLKEQGIEAEKIDYSKKNYLEKYDLVIVEQNGFNDYIENDELYIHEWVKNGGILMFMHQDYKRWAPHFLPREVGYTQLIHRYIETINGYSCAADSTFSNDPSKYMVYMMPWIENKGRRLFSEPEIIEPEDMIYWNIKVNTFSLTESWQNHNASEAVRTSALSCFLATEGWEILGSYMDPAVKDGALILKSDYGKGMFFVNQILFPEIFDSEAGRCFDFWKKYVKNLMAYFTRFKTGEPEIISGEIKKEISLKKNYKTAIHVHSLDWYGTDSHPGTINAVMRYFGYDICALSLKDNASYDGKLDTEKYSDDKVLFLDGQEYHPFNWNDSYSNVSHNVYHSLAIGIENDAYTQEFTRSLFSDEEVDEYLKAVTDYVHKKGGAICATHPYASKWRDFDYDAADVEPMRPLSGSDIEAEWLKGRRLAVMNSVDFFGVRRMVDNPAANFIYLKCKKPCRKTIVEAIKNAQTIAAAGFESADITIGKYVPGDEIPRRELSNLSIEISAKVMSGNIKKLRIYSEADEIYSLNNIEKESIDIKIPLEGFDIGDYIRVEIEGRNEHWICNSSPFYVG